MSTETLRAADEDVHCQKYLRLGAIRSVRESGRVKEPGRTF